MPTRSDKVLTLRASSQPTALGILSVALLLLFGWRMILAVTGWRAEYAESGYHQNLLRIEAFRQRMADSNPPRFVLAGTSISGRLLPKFFDSTPLEGIASLGLDGNSPAFALELIDQLPRLPKQVLLETYLLHKSATQNETNVSESLNAPGGRLAQLDPMLQTRCRPSTLLYSTLKRRLESSAVGQPVSGTPYHPRNAPSDEALDRLNSVIARLQARGCEIVLVDVPVGTDWPPGNNLGEPTATELVGRFRLHRVDPRASLLQQNQALRFTDGVHLDTASARVTAHAIAALALRNK